MIDSPILRSQANEIHAAILRVGLNPADFEWRTRSSEMASGLTVSVLCHKASPYHFVFDFTANKTHWSTFSPGGQSHLEQENSGTWDQQSQTVNRWLGYVTREVFATDLWASVSRETAIIAAQDAPDNTGFSATDVQRLAASLFEIKEFLRSTQQLNEAHMRFVEARLTYLSEASHRLGRKDWINMAVGVFTNIVVGVALNPDAARELFRFIGAALAWAFSSQLLLPG